MIVLAIETSCDETSLALLETERSDRFNDIIRNTRVLSSVISSQISIHQNYGGVVPEVGAREHAQNIHGLFEVLCTELHKTTSVSDVLASIDLICVTTEPGLVSALRVGIEFSKTVQWYLRAYYQKDVPIQLVNHLRGHVASSFFGQDIAAQEVLFPHIHLLVSGGNSQILLHNSWHDWTIIGQTLDDAAGECFDKTGRMIGLPYPAGVYISKIAGHNHINVLDIPIAMKHSQDYNYSFSGVKTAVRYIVQDKNSIIQFEKRLSKDKIDQLIDGTLNTEELELVFKISVSVQTAIVDQLIMKLKRALVHYSPATIGLSGGVSANPLLRQEIMRLASAQNISQTYIPPKELSGDNAVMIGMAGILDFFLPKKM